MNKISVLMSVYKKDNPEWLELAVKSILNQTIKPYEVIIIIDGEISKELENKLEYLKNEDLTIKILKNETNLGLGLTMQKGVLECQSEIIARMDSDDYSVPDRLEKEYNYMMSNNLDIVGSQVKEFSENINNVISVKNVPVDHSQIVKFSKTRCPFSHPTVMFKKSKVLESGNYQDLKLCEDYYLWIRMIQNNCKVGNIDEFLVYMRVNLDTYARRGGYKYWKNQKKLFKFMLKTHYINFFTYLKCVVGRFFIQVILPKNLRKNFYLKKLRTNNE